MLRFCDCPAGNDCDFWASDILLPFIRKGSANLGVSVRSRIRKSWNEPKRRNNSVVVATTLDQTQAKDKNTPLKCIAKGDLQHGVSATKWKDDCQEVPSGWRRKTICNGVTEGRSNLGNQVTRCSRSPTAPSYEQLGGSADSIETNMEFAGKKAWYLHKNSYKVQGTCSSM